jgi:hypothetical protein
MTNDITFDSDREEVLEMVVVQHIRDGLASGSEIAVALARSLLTELEAAGLDLGHHFNRGKAVTG